MKTADVKTVPMFGPSISDPSQIVNRDVPACDMQAYKAAGYKVGSVEVVAPPMPEPVEEVKESKAVDMPKGKGKR
jgi:hypothetical protein